MPIDPDTALGAELAPVSFSWNESEVMRYHLGIGAGNDPFSSAQLWYTYEKDLRVLPTFATVAATVNTVEPPVVSMPGVDIDLARVVHGGQSVTAHRPIPARGSATARTVVSALQDKGNAAVIEQRTEVHDEQGRPLWTALSSIFARGEGGFGGERGSSVHTPPPDRTPDRVIDTPTLPQQALLYRLCGDRNPLHADPEFAAAAGFEKPILHGLCTYGIVARALTDALLDSEVAAVGSWSVRFAGTVIPGETLRSEVWMSPDRFMVRTTTVERGNPVLDNAVLVIKSDN